MDSVSRFQNHPMPLSNVSFNKPPATQNEAVGMKPLLLDRFRAMVKEREEELGFFSGLGEEAVSPLSGDEIVRLYQAALSELTFNSKPTITDLTIIAGEQRAHAKGIADAICARIIEVPVDQKLPSLYLLDSIVKNIGKEYIKYFSAHLPEVFCEAYAEVHPNMHPAMRHLFGTWSAVFPLTVLLKIEERLQFSPSVNGQTSGLNSLRASESPRPAHGIHVNPKYLEARRQFGHSTMDVVGAEGASLTGGAGLTTSGLDTGKKSLPSTARITMSTSPYRIGQARSLSPSIDEFSVDNSPRKVAVRASPSQSGIDYGLSRVMGREEEISERRTRNWQGKSNQPLRTSAAYNYNNGVDLRGPRALINAYGIDEREKHLNRKHQTMEQLDGNGVDPKVAIRTWQNTEEEEFDWEDMTPALADRRQSNEVYSSSLPHPGNSMPRHSFSTNPAAPLVADYMGNWSKDQVSSVANSAFVDDVSHISSGIGAVNKIRGILPNVGGPSDLTSQLRPPSFSRESLIFPHHQFQSHLNAKGGGPFPENRSFFTAGDPRPTLMGSFPKIDGKFGGHSNAVSKLSSTYDSLAPEIRPADAEALIKAQHPAKLSSSHILPSHSTLPQHLQNRGQFGVNKTGNIIVDHGMSKAIHSEQHHLDGNTNMSKLTLPQLPSQRPGLVPLNLQTPAQISLLQPNLLMPQEVRQNSLLLPSATVPSHATVPPTDHGYLAQGRGPPIGFMPSNLVPGVHPPLPIFSAPNVSFHMPGAAFPSVPSGPRPGTTPNIGQVAPNPTAVGPLSSLFSSLVAQGLISMTKQESFRVEFDPDSLKVRNESAITALYADLPRQCTTCGLRFKSQEEHRKHMDWHVNKNRTLKIRKTKPSPKWFVSVSMWLHGAEALGTEAVPGFLPPENTVEKEEDEEMAVPAEEDQNACALCGERFDDFYSDEMEEWMYKGAVYMYAPAGTTVRMERSQLGPIVHAKCRSDSHGLQSEDLTKDEGESTEEGGLRKKLRS